MAYRRTTLPPGLLQKYPNPYFVETGTASGDGVHKAMESQLFKKVYSIELWEGLQERNRARFSLYIRTGRIELITGDSCAELARLIPRLDEPATFWLDAHVDKEDGGPTGETTCPLYRELEAIAASPIKTHTIMIDDMRIVRAGAKWADSAATLDGIFDRLRAINEDYLVRYEDSAIAPLDILVASVK